MSNQNKIQPEDWTPAEFDTTCIECDRLIAKDEQTIVVKYHGVPMRMCAECAKREIGEAK